MSSHSPSPQAAEKRESGGATTPAPWVADGNGVHHGSSCVATTHMQPRERRVADARLIAAAPEMLAALKVILARYVELAGGGDCGFWNPEEEAEVKAARAAIAKATLT